MKASKITHHNETRIRVDFPYNAEQVTKLRQLPDARWSKTLKAWHVPYTREVFEALKKLFPDVEIKTATEINKQVNQIELPDKTKVTSSEKEEQKSSSELTATETAIEHLVESRKLVLHRSQKVTAKINTDVEITVTPMHLYVKLPKNETDIQFLKSFRFAKWDQTNFQ